MLVEDVTDEIAAIETSLSAVNLDECPSLKHTSVRELSKAEFTEPSLLRHSLSAAKCHDRRVIFVVNQLERGRISLLLMNKVTLARKLDDAGKRAVGILSFYDSIKTIRRDTLASVRMGDDTIAVDPTTRALFDTFADSLEWHICTRDHTPIYCEAFVRYDAVARQRKLSIPADAPCIEGTAPEEFHAHINRLVLRDVLIRIYDGVKERPLIV